ncbi:MAG: pitrilysin family protein, partial [Bdellovibrionota bacterium]
VLGERETVRGFARAGLQKAHARALDPRRMVVAAVGDVEPGRVLAEIEKSFGALRPSAGEIPALHAALPESPQYAEEVLDRAQAHLAIGFPGTKIDAPDRFAMETLNTILSGQGGRLFLHLRDRMSLAYSVGSVAVEGIEPGLFATYIGTAPEKLSSAYGAMREEIRHIRERPVGSQELARAKRHLAASHAIDLQGTDARASQYALNELYGLGYEAGARYEKEIGKVTVQDVQNVARKYLDFGRAVLAVVRPSRVTSLEGNWGASAPSVAARS